MGEPWGLRAAGGGGEVEREERGGGCSMLGPQKPGQITVTSLSLCL